MRRLVVVGGGIAGLAAAWSASRRGVDVTVLERGPEVGGKAQSLKEDDWLLEAGPGGFLDGRPELTRLIDEAGLADQRVPANPVAKRRFIYRAGKIREIVPNPVGLLRSGLLTPLALLRMGVEPFIPARRDGDEETVWNFAARRLGTQVADRLILPMALGIFAGDAHRLSLSAAFPRMAALERDYGSLIKALFAKRGRTASGPLTSFRGGLQTLPRTLAARGGFTVRCGAEVRGLERGESAWRIALAHADAPVEADAVIVAADASSAAALLRPVAPDAASAYDAIHCPAVSVVGLGYDAGAGGTLPEGFGVLIARDAGYRALGHLWDSHLFPNRSPGGHRLIRALFGGAVDPEAGEWTEDELLRVAREEIERLYGIRGEPAFARVVRWRRAIPQYEIGHQDRVAGIERAVAAIPGLYVAGNGLHGVAFSDAAASGMRAGEAAAARLAGTTTTASAR